MGAGSVGWMRLVLLAISVAGVALLAWSSTLPWHGQFFTLPVIVRIAMGVAGLAILTLCGRASTGRVTVGASVLGGSVLLYPSLLALGAALPGSEPAQLLSSTGHILPILLMQVIPVLASSGAAGRTTVRYEAILIVIATVAIGCSAVGSMATPGSAIAGVVGTTLWFVQLGFAPVVTWRTVAGLGGEARRRAVLAALAATVPVLLIGSCLLLGAAADGFGLGMDGSVTVLMLAFSIAAVAAAALSLGTAAAADAWVLRPPVIVAFLDGLLATFLIVTISGIAVGGWALGAPPAAAVTAGAAGAVAVTALWRRSRRALLRLIVPASILRQELAAADATPEGQLRQLALRAVRRTVEDPRLQLRFRLSDGSWTDERGEPSDAGSIVIARRDGREPAVTAHPSLAAAIPRLVALGDCSVMLAPATFEAHLAAESRRADAAAAGERRRLQRDLHDGLQGRLLGLALGLQLSGRRLDDPSARLLIDETVTALRSAVEEVRALGGGALPEVLQEEGLESAVRSLLGPLAPLVDWELPGERLSAPLETTAYFVIGEAVTNALKHSGATRIGVRVASLDDARVTVMVRDDGCGGADPRAGTGLRSLAERVAAAGGQLLVRDAQTRGTIV